jgi:thiosulfate/3-mercaptopyruvate sulfurtransferase
LHKHYHTLISVQELHDQWQGDQIILLDCTYYLNDFNRGRREYLQAHIPGAYFLDIAHDLSGPIKPGETGRHPLPDPLIMSSTFSSCGINEDSQVVAYDQLNGVYASRAWWLLNWLGHSNVAVLNGGFETWKKKGNETDNQWTAPVKGNFKHHLRPELTAAKEEINTTSLPLVDSREYKRFIGEVEPIDPVAGHIKGPFAFLIWIM